MTSQNSSPTSCSKNPSFSTISDDADLLNVNIEQMTSQNSSTSFHSKYFGSSTLTDDAEYCLSKMKESLENANRNDRIEAMQAMLTKGLLICSPNLLEEKLFSIALPVAQQLFFETIEELNEILMNTSLETLRDIKQKLHSCRCLLDCWKKCLEHIDWLQRISVSNIKSFPELLPQVIKCSFEHCKTSERIYGNFFKEATNELTILFRKTNTVLNLFFAALDGPIIFDSKVELEMTILARVINAIGDIAVLVNGMDLQTVANVWKAFGKLTVTYKDDLMRAQLSSCVTPHLVSMANNIIFFLHAAIQVRDGKNDERTIKCGGLLLKLLDKLCVCYSKSLTNEVALPFVQLLVQLHRHSPPFLKAINLDPKIIDYVRINISIGADPFLKTIIGNAHFRRVFFEYDTQEKLDRAGYHLLTLSIAKKLINMPNECASDWLTGPKTILDIVMGNVNFLEGDLCAGHVRLEGFHELGEQTRQIGLYEATLVPICGLVSQIPTSEFNRVELLLLKQLLSGRFWCSLLASDVWCFVNRLGSSALCYHHVKYLMRVYEALVPRKNSLEVIFLSNLIGRLFTLLPADLRNSLVENLDANNPSLWTPVSQFLSPQEKSRLCERSSTDTDDISGIFTDLNEESTVKNWNRLISKLTKLGVFGREKDEDTTKVLTEIWNCITKASEESEGIQSYLLTELIMILFESTRYGTISNEQFSSILSAMISLTSYATTHVRLKISHYLKDNVEIFNDCRPNVADLLSKLYCSLLEDENPLVRQEAFESFDRVVHACTNEELVTRIVTAVAEKPLIKEVLPAYLSGTPYSKLTAFPTIGAYLQRLSEESEYADGQRHTCYDRSNRARDEKRSKLDEPAVIQPPVTTVDLEKRVNFLCEEFEYILKRKNDLSKSSLEKIRIIASRIFD